MALNLQDYLAVLEQIAPLCLAAEWDRVGLLLGDKQAQVTRVMTCLTLTEDVAEEAAGWQANLVVTHHPLLFKPLQRITSDDPAGRVLLKLLSHHIAVYSPHTAWDNAPKGINANLAHLFELQDIRPLKVHPTTSAQAKVVVFVPESKLQAVREAAWSAGAGIIGAYRCCSFSAQGEGTFYGEADAHPAVGALGKLETVRECRLELVCPQLLVSTVERAIRQAHPYEEPAIDVYPLLSQASVSLGHGRYGHLSEPLTLQAMAERVCCKLGLEQVEVVGDPQRRVQRVAVACGSAGELWEDAHRRGCDLIITGEARFHTQLAARDTGVAMILAGHYATERPGIEHLAQLLHESCPEVEVRASQTETNPQSVISLARVNRADLGSVSVP